MLVDLLKTELNVRDFEDFLLVCGRERRQRGCNKVHQPAGLFDIDRNGLKLVRQRGRTSHDLLEQRQNIALQSLYFWARIDRKSTRLNSSHLGISYAVFCL